MFERIYGFQQNEVHSLGDERKRERRRRRTVMTSIN